jgi:hypothetical protein
MEVLSCALNFGASRRKDAAYIPLCTEILASGALHFHVGFDFGTRHLLFLLLYFFKIVQYTACSRRQAPETSRLPNDAYLQLKSQNNGRSLGSSLAFFVRMDFSMMFAVSARCNGVMSRIGHIRQHTSVADLSMNQKRVAGLFNEP